MNAEMPKILYQDDFLLILDKPAGMAAANLCADETGTLAAWILDAFPEQRKLPDGALEAGLVHRLDNDTSGVIVAARTMETYENLRQQLADHAIHKEYLALVVGIPPNAGRIDAPIAHHPRKKKKMVVCESSERARELKAREAHTAFSVERRFQFRGDGIPLPYALLRVTIETGVRHQIRAHLSGLGFPLSGDTLYQNPKKREQDPLAPTHHLLHAETISFIHSKSGAQLTFTTPLPKPFEAALRRLIAV